MIESNDYLSFWYHPYIGGTGIHGLYESIFPNSFHLYEKYKVDKSKKNFVTFFWDREITNEFISIIRELNDLGFYFLIDYSTETINSVETGKLYMLNQLQLNGINMDNIIICTNNSESFEKTKIEYGEFVLNHVCFPHFLLGTPLKMDSYIEDLSIFYNTKKEYDFLCLNRRMNKQKFRFLKRLWLHGVLDRTKWTWVTTVIPPRILKNNDFTKYLNIDFDNFKPFQLEEDVFYGEELAIRDEYLYTINPKWYYKSKVNIITETNTFTQPIHLTEKTFKPIYLGVPFVVFGSHFHLKNLKKMGFETFDRLIDESYDISSDPYKIINSAIELAEIYDDIEVRDICIYNQEKIMSFNHRKEMLENIFKKNL